MLPIDNPNLWFAFAAGGGLMLGFLVYLLGYFDGREAGDVAPEWVGMIDGARWDCRRCGGTGWTPVLDERAMTHCACTKLLQIEERPAGRTA